MSHPLGQKLVKDAAGTLEYLPPPEHGQPASGTISILAPGGVALPAAVSGAALTVDSVSTTLSADVALGATSLTVASATGITVGRTYVLATAGQRELVRVKAVSGTTVTLVDELQVDHANGASLKGHRLTYALVAGQQATADRNYSAAIAWVDEDGTTHHAHFAYHVVHWPWRLPTTTQDVLEAEPDAQIQRAVRERGLSFRDTLDWAAAEIARELRERGYVEDQFFDQDAFVPLHVDYVRYRLARQRWAHDPEQLLALDEYWDDAETGRIPRRWHLLLGRLPAYDEDNDGILDAPGEEDKQEERRHLVPTGWERENLDGADTDEFEPQFAKVGTSDYSRTVW